MYMTGRGFLLVFAGLLMAGCRSSEDRWRPETTDLRGSVLPGGLPKVDFTLTSVHGEPFNFREETEGYVTMLFFGYTYCPDVCPLHMANLAAVLEQLPPSVANRIKVVFVTTDPERDTPERLRQWLAAFNTDFIGLAGPLDVVNAIQQEIGLGPSYREDLPEGGYGMAHAAQVVAYTTDNLAHVLYPFGTRQADFAYDLPKLVDGPPVP